MSIDTRIGIDEHKLFEKLPQVIEAQRTKLIESHHNTKAWKWLLQEDIFPKFANMEIVHAYLDDYASSLYIHVLINRREDIQTYISIFESDENWELYDEDKDLAKRVGNDWRKGSYISYNYNPTVDYTKKITEAFGGKLTYINDEVSFSQYQFDIYLYFFPAEESECVITDLGKVEVVTEKRVFEVTCKEGAAESW